MSYATMVHYHSCLTFEFRVMTPPGVSDCSDEFNTIIALSEQHLTDHSIYRLYIKHLCVIQHAFLTWILSDNKSKVT